MVEPNNQFSILLIEANEANLPFIQEHLSSRTDKPSRLDVSRNISEAIEKIKKNRYHVILADDEFSEGEDIADVLSEINRRKLSTPLILMIRPGEEARAHWALKFGATDYLVKTEDGLQNLPKRLWSIYRSFELTVPQGDLSGQISEQNQKLLEINEKLRDLAIRDELTGLYNHRYLQERLVEEFTRAVRYGYPLSCLFIDLDLFRRVNEQLSHNVGDVILKEAADILLKNCRLSDLIARFGGEEFAILLPHVDYQGAFELAERLRMLFAEHTFLARSHQINVTVSVGIACFPDDQVKQRSDLLHFSDQALFRAKAAGRNRVALYRDLLPAIGQVLPDLQISEEKVLQFQRRLSDVADTARRAYIESSKAMIMALENKDPFTAGHSGRTARFSLQLAEAMGIPLDEAEVIEHAGLLHDIGKICISDDILLKPGRLTLAEYEAMKQHPYFGYRIVKPVKFLQQEATLILHHHEWFNGEGYPCRLSRNEIPLGARIIAVVDSYDTMRQAGERYKKTQSVEETVNELITCSGTQFDPEVVQAFIQVLLMRKELGPDSYNKERLKQALNGNK